MELRARPSQLGVALVVAGLVTAVVAFGALRRQPSAAPVTAPGPPHGVPMLPDVAAEATFAALGPFVDLTVRAARLGLLPPAAAAVSVTGLTEAGLGAPVVVALRPPLGEAVVSARVTDGARLAATLALAVPRTGLRFERRLGEVDALLDDAGVVRAVVRVGDDAVVFALEPADPLASAALLEAMATGTWPTRRVTSSTTGFRVGARPDVPETIGTINLAGDVVTLAATAVVEGALADVARGLRSAAPSFSCAAEEGAIVAARLPPVVGAVVNDAGLGGTLARDAADSFDGRVLFALHPPVAGTPLLSADRATLGALVVAARPRPGSRAALEAALGPVSPRPVRVVAGRGVRAVAVPGRPWRDVSAVVDDDVFALGIGADTAVDRVAAAATCPAAPDRLLVVDGQRLRAALARARPEGALLDMLAQGASDAAITAMAGLPPPWGALLGVERWELDANFLAERDTGVAVGLTLRVRLPPVR